VERRILLMVGGLVEEGVYTSYKCTNQTSVRSPKGQTAFKRSGACSVGMPTGFICTAKPLFPILKDRPVFKDPGAARFCELKCANCLLSAV
jgi:hypothetical protein